MKPHSHSFEHFEDTLVFSSDGHITQQSRDSAAGIRCCLITSLAFGLVDGRDLRIATGC